MPPDTDLKAMINPRVFRKEELESVLALRDRRSVKLVDWTVFGQPGPDVFKGSFQVSPNAASSLISELLKLNEIRLQFRVFPLGIPFPDIFRIDFEAGATAHH